MKFKNKLNLFIKSNISMSDDNNSDVKGLNFRDIKWMDSNNPIVSHDPTKAWEEIVVEIINRLETLEKAVKKLDGSHDSECHGCDDSGRWFW